MVRQPIDRSIGRQGPTDRSIGCRIASRPAARIVTVTSTDAPTADRIRSAALRLFAHKGFAAVGIRELADAAGLSSASLYHHMGTKDELLVSIMDDGQTRLTEIAAAALEGVERPEIRLARLAQVHVVMHAVYQLECRVVDTELRSLTGSDRTRVVAARDDYQRLWTSAVADGITDGVFSVEQPKLTVLALLDLCTGVAAWFRPGGELDAYELAHHHAGLALAIVGARRGRTALRQQHVSLLPAHWFTDRWRSVGV